MCPFWIPVVTNERSAAKLRKKKKPTKNCQKYITLGQQIIERNYCKKTLREYTTK
jgi:intracellular sulfur oxidation DsrE/DsrF family protein